jgi:hypothetical protein
LTLESPGFEIGSKVCARTFEKDTPQKIYIVVFREAVAFQDHPSAQRHQMCIDTSSGNARVD